MRDGYIRYAEQKVRDLKAVADAAARNNVTLDQINESWLEPQRILAFSVTRVVGGKRTSSSRS